MQRLAESIRLRLGIVALLWLFAAGSVLLMFWAWNTYSYTLRVVVAFAFFAEFSVVATCFTILRRIAKSRPITASFVLASLLLWELVPGAIILFPFAILHPITAVPVILTVVLAARARNLAARGSALAGTTTLLLPAAFVVAVCFYRPWSVSSEIWPVVGTIHAAVLLIALCLVAVYVWHSRHNHLQAQ
jgi:hypothetical protein